MEIIAQPAAMQAAARELRRAGRTVALVPTMGCLHAGHLALVRRARAAAEDRPAVILSVFVNPTQFGPGEDYERYPRTFEADCRLCEREQVDLVFHPDAADMYPGPATAAVTESELAAVLCGASRPGHFQGVLTVVAKLFNLTLPDLAVFGQKDAQQLRLIERMVRDLNFPVHVLRAPIVREPDGLALSSRNRYLSESERRDALCLVRALQAARDLFRRGEREAAALAAAMAAVIGRAPAARADYIAVVDDATLRPVRRLEAPTLLALAVRLGTTRLIDNLMLPDDRLCALPE